MSARHRLFAAAAAIAALHAGCTGPAPPFPGTPEPGSAGPADDLLRHPPIEAGDAAGTFRVQNGFRMELIAAEPLVYDPVAMVYDENGRAYVAEMSDYPYTDKRTATPREEQTDQAPIGRVRVLEDVDGDGDFDRGEVFAEGLSWPTGLGVWKGGVFVAATPDIWYLKDTDGDLRADVRERVYTGFRKYNVQSVINNLTFGLDHRFYGAGATNGGSIRRVDRPDLDPVDLGRNDFRFDPVGGRLEIVSGGSQFGNAFDDWGNRFLSHNSRPVQHVVLPDEYLRRNPYLPVAGVLHDVAGPPSEIPLYKISPPEPWRVVRARIRVDDPRYAEQSKLDLQGITHWTAATGVTVYRGDAYPAEYRGNLFIGEVASNVVHRQRVSPDGVTFRSERADAGAEFVASIDPWFRGVNLVNAPDGTIHVLDMYRQTVEHPWSLPDDLHARLDLRAGTDRGRIYRLAPPGFRPPPLPRLGSATTADLVAELASQNGWRRDTAHRLIFERQDLAAVGPLRRLLFDSQSPLARLHALWSLEGLQALREDEILRALHDPASGVREHAVRLAERRIRRSAELLERLLEMAEDPDARVRMQVAFTLGESNDPRVVPALSAIALRDPDDSWVRTAVVSSAARTAAEVLAALLDRSGPAGQLRGVTETAGLLALTVGARNHEPEVERVMALVREDADRAGFALRAAVVDGLASGLQRSDRKLRITGAGLESLLRHARVRAADASAPLPERLAAVRLLAHAAVDVTEPLAAALAPGEPAELQIAAVRVLADREEASASAALIGGWAGYTPMLRGEVLDAMLSGSRRTALLLDALESGAIPPSEISPLARSRLLRVSDESLAGRARALFKATGGDRESVIERYASALGGPADATRGATVYRQFCASCHRFRGEGAAVGPPLEGVSHKTGEEVLAMILAPNREVAPEYLLYDVQLSDGGSAAGIIAAETPSSLTLKRPGGGEQTILRADVRAVRSTGVSLMPEGLEAGIDPQAMADLLAYLLER